MPVYNLNNSSDRAQAAAAELVRRGLPLTQSNVNAMAASPNAQSAPTSQLQTVADVAAAAAEDEYIYHSYSAPLPGTPAAVLLPQVVWAGDKGAANVATSTNKILMLVAVAIGVFVVSRPRKKERG